MPVTTPLQTEESKPQPTPAEPSTKKAKKAKKPKKAKKQPAESAAQQPKPQPVKQPMEQPMEQPVEQPTSQVVGVSEEQGENGYSAEAMKIIGFLEDTVRFKICIDSR